jgi:hypothetical protein
MREFSTDSSEDDDLVQPQTPQDLRAADDGWGDDLPTGSRDGDETPGNNHQETASTVFLEKPKERDPDRYDMYFNRTGRIEDQHGHVVETRHPNGDRTYHYVYDEEGNEYIDDGRRRNSR